MRMLDATDRTHQDGVFVSGKIKTGNFFFQYCLPEADLFMSRFFAGGSIAMSLTEAEF
jgi:hypothetical protein